MTVHRPPELAAQWRLDTSYFRLPPHERHRNFNWLQRQIMHMSKDGVSKNGIIMVLQASGISKWKAAKEVRIVELKMRAFDY